MDCRRPQTRNPDAWLENAPAFSAAMAAQFRDWILSTEPDLSEAIKWNMLCFSGRKLVCGLSACQKHVGVAFFRGVELPDPAKLLVPADNNTSILSMRVTAIGQVDVRAFKVLLRAAAALDADLAAPPPPKIKREPWRMPDFFAKALKGNRKAASGFAALKPTYQREYLIWVSSAKRDETRAERVKQTLKALAAGLKWIDRKSA